MTEFNKHQRYIIAVDDDAIILNVLINHLKRFLPEDIKLIALDNAASALEACNGIVEAESELVLIIGTNCANGKDIRILPKKIINKTAPNNNICLPIIKIKSDVEVSITHLSMSTIFM